MRGAIKGAISPHGEKVMFEFIDVVSLGSKYQRIPNHHHHHCPPDPGWSPHTVTLWAAVIADILLLNKKGPAATN